MPSLINSEERAEYVAEVVTRLLAAGGQGAVTTRAIAQEAGLGWQSLAHHFGGRHRLMDVSCRLAGRAHLDRVSDRLTAGGVGGLMPNDEESRALDRAWLAWTDLARFDDRLGYRVADTEAAETFAISRVLDPGAEEDDVEILAAAVRGFRAAVCRREDPTPPDVARHRLERLAAYLTRTAAARSASTIASGSSAE